VLLCGAFAGSARADKLSVDERLEIERNLTAEYALAKVALPRSKKPLIVKADGSYDRGKWQDAMRDGGPTARIGDQVQITRVTIEANRILFEIDGGTKGKGHWYDHVQVGMSGSTNPMETEQSTTAGVAKGTYLALIFDKSVPSLNSAQIRQMLAPVLDFDKHTASEQYVERLPEPVRQAIKEQHAIEGMDKDEVLLAMGKPHSKSRETDKDGNELEDWIYGEPPGKVVFVRFVEGKVTRIEDSYANIGGTTAPPLPPVR
jgi:hypothetical protein